MDFVHPIAAVIPGAQGRMLAVLAETTAALNMRTLARLSDVSLAQASRVLPGLVALGIVGRDEVPPSSQFRLVREQVAARAVLALAGVRETALAEMGAAAATLKVPPVTAIVFGSFARGEADGDSDIDVMFVRPGDLDEDDESWAASVEQWRSHVQSITGNPVEILEVGLGDAASRLAGKRQVWHDIRRDGRVFHGLSLGDLAGVRRA